MKIVRNLDELDCMLAACDKATTDDALRAVFAEFRMDIAKDGPEDPFSAEYHDHQMSLYRRISGRKYTLANEASYFDVVSAVSRPFPYSTGSCKTAGEHLVTIGQFLSHLNLPPGSRILEFGFGWGNLTLALAALGHRVTAVDVEPRFCDLVRRRAAQLGLPIDVVNADFSWADTVSEPFDAIIFFECFHHAVDHRSVLRGLHKALRTSGRVYMGGEPISADFPVPWGLRMDGQSLWSIRKFGWMELGFRDDYFFEALSATGWTGTRHALFHPPIWELRRNSVHLHFAAADARLGSITGRRLGADLVFENADPGPALFGPYLTLPQGKYRVRIYFSRACILLGTGEMQVCADGATTILVRRTIDMADLAPERSYSELCFMLAHTHCDIEVRFLNDRGFTGHITNIEITDAG